MAPSHLPPWKKRLKAEAGLRKKLVKELDALVRQIVLARDQRCVTCGTKNRPSPGHLFSRTAYSTRWDLDNVFQQCIGCNLFHEMDSYPFTKYFIDRFGQEKWDALHLKYSTPQKFSNPDLLELKDKLVALLPSPV